MPKDRSVFGAIDQAIVPLNKSLAAL